MKVIKVLVPVDLYKFFEHVSGFLHHFIIIIYLLSKHISLHSNPFLCKFFSTKFLECVSHPIRNLHKIFASNFHVAACKILYKLAWNKAAFHLVQKLAQEKLAEKSMSGMQVSCTIRLVQFSSACIMATMMIHHQLFCTAPHIRSALQIHSTPFLH